MSILILKKQGSSLESTIKRLRDIYEENADICGSNPRLLDQFSRRKLNLKFIDFEFTAKSILIQNYFIENNNALTIHTTNAPVPFPNFLMNNQILYDCVYRIRSRQKSYTMAFNRFFNDDTFDNNFHELYNNYLVDVIFPTIFCNFISDEFNRDANNMLKIYLEDYGFDGYFEKLMGSLLMNSFYAITSLEDEFIQNIVNYLSKKSQYENISLEFIFEKFVESYSHSLMNYSEHVIDLIKYVASKDPKKLEALLLEYFLHPSLKRIVHSPYLFKTMIFKKVMQENSLVELINIIKNDEEKKTKLFEPFWKEISVTQSRIPLKLNGDALIHLDSSKIFLSVMDIIYIEQLINYAGQMNQLTTNWPDKIEKDINCFQNAFYIIPAISIKYEKIPPFPEIKTLIVKPSEERMKNEWEKMHGQIVGKCISPLDEFVSPKYSQEFIRLALGCEINILFQTKKFQDGIRDRLLNLRPLDENLESVERVLQEVSLYYSSIYQLDHNEFESSMYKELVNYQENLGMNALIHYGNSRDNVNDLIRTFLLVFENDIKNIDLRKENELENLFKSMVKVLSEYNKGRIEKNYLRMSIQSIDPCLKMFHIYLQNQALLYLDNISLPKAKSDNVIEGPPDGMNLETFFSVLQLPIDYLRAIIMLHNNQSSHFEGSQILGIKSFVDTMNSIIDTVDINSIIDESDHHHSHARARALVGQSLICFMFNNDLSNDLFVSFSNLVNSCKSLIDNRQEQLHLSEDLVQSINAAYSWFNKE